MADSDTSRMGEFLDEEIDAWIRSLSRPSEALWQGTSPYEVASIADEEGCPRNSASWWSIELDIKNRAETSKACQTLLLASKSRRPRKLFRQTDRNKVWYLARTTKSDKGDWTRDNNKQQQSYTNSCRVKLQIG
jgi:hypothetical protein